MRHRLLLTVAFSASLIAGEARPAPPLEKDSHSHSNPQHVCVRHIDLDLDVRFAGKILKGRAILTVERTSEDRSQSLVLDTRGLRIEKVEASSDGAAYADALFRIGPADRILGAPLTVRLPEQVRLVRINYSTGPDASGLQWLDREQTAGKRQPFLFTQSESIHARSWIPLQDTPGVRVTYSARVRVPPGMVALMSAAGNPQRPGGEPHFEMAHPVPSYLIALAVGELEFRSLGPRTGVYAEPPIVARAAAEFSDLEKMMRAVEELYGPYRWGRYDVLVLPPSFPLGGMENPRLTFATPTILAGDKSLVSLVAHELAHSWSGNLVSNATWRDFWLNEGFTVYLERRILEKVYGRERAAMEAFLGRRSLEREMGGLPPRDQVLHVDLTGRDPDDGLTDVPYEKGALFLKALEQAFGRERFDTFLKEYFAHFAFRSITTEDFLTYLRKNLLEKDPAAAARIPVEEWVQRPGVPETAPRLESDALARVERQAHNWLKDEIPTRNLKTGGWSTQEWLHFLQSLPDAVGRKRMQELDEAFGITRSGNAEILHQWLLMAVRNRFEPAYPRLEEFLTSMGRRKFLKPLYEELVKTPEGKVRALAIYRKARPTYHPIAVTTVDAITGWRK